MDSELAAIWGCNSVNIVSLCSSEGFKNVAFCFTATFFFIRLPFPFVSTLTFNVPTVFFLSILIISSSFFVLLPFSFSCRCKVCLHNHYVILCVWPALTYPVCAETFHKTRKNKLQNAQANIFCSKKKRKKKQPASLILPPCESVFEMISISSKQPRWMCHFCVLQNSSRSLKLGHAWWNMCSMLAGLQRPQCWVMHRTFPPRDRGSCPVGVKIDYIHHQFK